MIRFLPLPPSDFTLHTSHLTLSFPSCSSSFVCRGIRRILVSCREDEMPAGWLNTLVGTG